MTFVHEDKGTWKAKVVNGRLELIDVATDLPDGKELNLREAEDDELDTALTPEEEDGIRKALASLRRGEGIPYDEVKATLDRLLKT